MAGSIHDPFNADSEDTTERPPGSITNPVGTPQYVEPAPATDVPEDEVLPERVSSSPVRSPLGEDAEALTPHDMLSLLISQLIAAGIEGTPGSDGSNGADGDDGAPGAAGPAGPQGDPGPTVPAEVDALGAVELVSVPVDPAHPKALGPPDVGTAAAADTGDFDPAGSAAAAQDYADTQDAERMAWADRVITMFDGYPALPGNLLCSTVPIDRNTEVQQIDGVNVSGTDYILGLGEVDPIERAVYTWDGIAWGIVYGTFQGQLFCCTAGSLNQGIYLNVAQGDWGVDEPDWRNLIDGVNDRFAPISMRELYASTVFIGGQWVFLAAPIFRSAVQSSSFTASDIDSAIAFQLMSGGLKYKSGGTVSLDYNQNDGSVIRGHSADGVESDLKWRKFRRATRNVANINTTLTNIDWRVVYTTLTAGRTVTLPVISQCFEGQQFQVVDASNAAGTYNITVQRAGADTFLGAGTNKKLASNGAAAVFEVVNGKWQVTASVGTIT